jgi:hypothetical protein
MPLAFDGDKTGYGSDNFDLIFFLFTPFIRPFKWGRLHVPHSNHSALYDVGQHVHSAFTRERLVSWRRHDRRAIRLEAQNSIPCLACQLQSERRSGY